MLAVIGSKGAPGASECAASLAALASERWTCVLVDLDALGGGFDLRLGVDPRQGSCSGSRAVASGDGALGELLERWLAVREGWPPVLVGPPDPEQALGELARPGAVAATLRPRFGASARHRRHRLLALGGSRGGRSVPRPPRSARGGRRCPPRPGRARGAAAGGPHAARRSSSSASTAAAARRRQRRRRSGSDDEDRARAGGRRQLAERRFALDAWLPWDGRALARAQRTGVPCGRPPARPLHPRAKAAARRVLPAGRSRAARAKAAACSAPATRGEAEEEVALPWRS